MLSQQANLLNFSVSKDLLREFDSKGHDLHIDEGGVVRPVLSRCPECGSPISDNGSNPVLDQRAVAFGLKIYKGRIACSNPDCSFSYCVSQDIVSGWLDELEEFLCLIIRSLGTKRLSSPMIGQHIREAFKIQISDEYVRLKLKEFTDSLNVPVLQFKPSKVMIHDEQFLKIKGKDIKRITGLDANNTNVYYDELYPDMTEKTLRLVARNIKTTMPDLFSVVIDGNSTSKKAFREEFGNNLLIQRCLFHFLMNFRKAFMDEAGFGKGRRMLPLDQLIAFISIGNIFFNHDRELHHLRELQAELDEATNRIYAEKYPHAKDYIKNWQEQ